jgi:hypothetical protein
LHTTSDGEFAVGGRDLPIGDRREGLQCSVRRTGEAVARFVAPDQVSFEHRQHPHCESYGHYLSALVPRVQSETIAWVLAAGPAGEVDVQARAVDSTEGAVQVRLGQARDTIALGAGEATEAGQLLFEGEVAMVRDSRGGVHRYALVEGTRLLMGAAELIVSDMPISAGAVIEDGVLRASIACSEAATATLHCPVEPQMVRLTGIDAPVDMTFDRNAGEVTMVLPRGSYELTIRQL